MISPFVQEAHTWLCAPSTTGGCTQQTFIWVVPNVAQGDTLKIAFWWFAAQTLTPSQFPVVTDNVNSVYTLVQEQTNVSGVQYSFIFSAPQVNSNGGDVTVKVVLPFATQNIVDLDALEYSAGFSLDSATGAEGLNSPLIQTAAIPVSTDADVLLSTYFGTFRPIAACSSCNARYVSPYSNFIVQDYLPPASGSYPASFATQGTFGSWTVSVAAFE